MIKRSGKKQTMIDFMVQYCGETPESAAYKFEPWASKRIKDTKKYNKIAEDITIDRKKLETIIIYLWRKGFVNKYIASVLGIENTLVDLIINNYKKNFFK